ncbi:ribosomal protein L18e/L15P [Lophiotrema nucula]|uniref:Ribosomal protein L18e/L15P n=1 Tax=Lophiotrema nucula TaxID=690887 RepID=A0A6A5ZW13_9PLEO|nr:ribosomal protein L18e/L15P [Lophiotrema nucula]
MPPRLTVVRIASSLLSRPNASPITSFLAPLLLPTQQRAASILSSLSDTPGAYSKKIRRGRGPASGKGKTAGRGQKGQHAHGKVPAGFQGGQTPLEITQRERGNRKFNHFKVEMSPINLDRIQSWIDQGRLDPTQPITMKQLNSSRCLHGVKSHGVKLLGRNANQLKTPINIVVSRASTSAIAAIEALGGSVTTRFYSPTGIKHVLRGDSHPTISLQASPALIQSVFKTPESGWDDVALKAARATVSGQYKYRLADATGRKDIEYYRDPAHRGYLSYLVKEGESPSLFFKPPGEAREKKGQTARRQSAKASADNRLF